MSMPIVSVDPPVAATPSWARLTNTTKSGGNRTRSLSLERFAEHGVRYSFHGREDADGRVGHLEFQGEFGYGRAS
jgi:hypothetical protein